MMKKESFLFLLLAASAALLGGYMVWRSSSLFPFGHGALRRHPGVARVSTDAEAGEGAAEKVVSGTKSGLSYEQALRQYGATNYRYQFVGCSGNPGTMTVESDEGFMIDNRDPSSHVFGVNGQSFTVKAYDFALAQVKAVGTFNITCDGKGAATVNIEK